MTRGWLTDLTSWLSSVWEAFAEFLSQLWRKLDRWWQVVLGVLMTVVSMTKEALEFLYDIGVAIFTSLEAIFGNIHGLDQTMALSGAPWGSTLCVINAFIPLKEIMAGAAMIALTMAAILTVAALSWLIKKIVEIAPVW